MHCLAFGGHRYSTGQFSGLAAGPAAGARAAARPVTGVGASTLFAAELGVSTEPVAGVGVVLDAAR